MGSIRKEFCGRRGRAEAATEATEALRSSQLTGGVRGGGGLEPDCVLSREFGLRFGLIVLVEIKHL